MKAHVIGICGVGMSATALLMKEAGWEVTGSDAASYGPTGEVLRNAGIVPKLGYSPANISSDADVFMVGRNAKLSPTENAEVQAALATGKPIRSFPEILGELTKNRPVTVVAGSYGKSTVTALIAHILFHAGTNGGWFVGAKPLSLAAPARLGEGPFVAEGDEYPSAHDDSRAKFMHLHPRDVVFTSLVHDHVNVYPTFADYQKPFRDLLASVPEDGFILVSAEEPGAVSLTEASGKKFVTYGVDKGTYQARDIVYGEETTFTLTKNNEELGRFSTILLGRHNIENIVAACAYALERNIVHTDPLPISILGTMILAFSGVRRRLDRVTPEGSIPTYEGFGSSYEKARSAIEAMRLHFPNRPLTIIFEPHTFGWRNRANLSWYDTAFSGATKVFIAPPETQGEGTHDQLSHEEILSRVHASGIEAVPYAPTHPEMVKESLAEHSCVLILSSGDFEGSLPSMIESLSKN